MLTADFEKLWSRRELFAAPESADGTEFFHGGADDPQPLVLYGTSVNGKRYAAAAYYGLPEGEPPFPAVILFHGGGGTAFPQYVRAWNRRGYAALTFDHYGKLPICEVTQPERPRIPGSWLEAEGIPDLCGDTTTTPATSLERWIGNAVSMAISANSFLRSRPEIAPDHIGLVGLSWGGLMGGIVAACDPRLDFAALIYGCGCNRVAEPESFFARFGGAPWEPEHFLPKAAIPICWIGGADDTCFSPRAWSASTLAAPGSAATALIPELGHSHKGYLHPLLRRFADARRGAATPLPHLGAIEARGGMLSAPVLAEGAGIRRVGSAFTCDRCPGPKRQWQRGPARSEGGRIAAAVPDSATACFLWADDADEETEKFLPTATSPCFDLP